MESCSCWSAVAFFCQSNIAGKHTDFAVLLCSSEFGAEKSSSFLSSSSNAHTMARRHVSSSGMHTGFRDDGRSLLGVETGLLMLYLMCLGPVSLDSAVLYISMQA